VNDSLYSSRVPTASEPSPKARRVQLVVAGVLLGAFALGIVALVRSGSGPSDTELLTGRKGTELLRKAAASTQSTDMLATRWNGRTILAAAKDGDTPVQALERFFDGVDKNELATNPALAGAAAADFFASVFPEGNDRPAQAALANEAEAVCGSNVELSELEGTAWTGVFVSAFADTLQSSIVDGVIAKPVVGVLSGRRSLGGDDLVWSSDGRLLARSSNEGSAQVWSVATAAALNLPTATSASETSVSFSPDGTQLAVVVVDDVNKPARLVLRSIADGTERSVATTDEPMRVWWSPDGVNLAVRSKTSITIVDAQTRMERERWTVDEGAQNPPLALAWSPDSTRVAYPTVLAAEVRDIADGRLIAKFLGDLVPLEPDKRIEFAYSVDWAADGTRIVSAANGGVVVWDARTGASLHANRTASPNDAQWLSGKRVLAGTFVWDITNDTWTPTLPGSTVGIPSVSNDGRLVAVALPDYVVIRKLK
jgi:WD40-like Beta Propeller Repeat